MNNDMFRSLHIEAKHIPDDFCASVRKPPCFAEALQNGGTTYRGRGNGFCAENGFVLHAAILLLLTVGAVAGFLFYAVYNHGQTVRRWHASDQCLLDAQSALEQVKYEIFQTYRVSQNFSTGALEWFQQWNLNAIGSNPVYNISVLSPINGSAVAVTIAGVRIATNAGYAEIELIGTAVRSSPFAVSRLICETLRVTGGSGGHNSRVFDYAYFVNNNARLEGDRRVINGDLRANGDFAFHNNPNVNGNIYASGAIAGNLQNWTQGSYWSRTMTAARPTDPTDAVGNNPWPMGYKADDVTRSTNVHAEFMPKIGDINQLADMANGTISRDGAVLAQDVYDGAGPDGIAGTADDGTLVLIGTSSARPINITGSVVVANDLIIRGYVSGQGAIYAGRNIHVVGGLSYLNPPVWPKPDANPTQTASANAAKDFLVLAARGNIVVGNYTTTAWSNRVWSIITDPVRISPRNVSVSDAEIGYDSDNNPDNGYAFDGRYDLPEANGGQRMSGDGTNTVPRKYYESSLADASFSSLCSPHVHAINAALFSNHGIMGDIGSSASAGNTIINGAMVCHDDMHNYYGAFTLNWDMRLGKESNESLGFNFLSDSEGTGTTAAATTIKWREIH